MPDALCQLCETVEPLTNTTPVRYVCPECSALLAKIAYPNVENALAVRTMRKAEP